MDEGGRQWVRGRMIGQGGFGRVYMAIRKYPEGLYSSYPAVMAVKSSVYLYSATLQNEKKILDTFAGCPNIIQCYGEEITPAGYVPIYNLLLEYASGGSLADVIYKTHGKGFAEADVKRFTKAIVKGIYDVHKHGYVHRDLKPENILIVQTSGGFVAKVADFGLAKRFRYTRRTRKDCYPSGTIKYMSPEAFHLCIQTPACDIWALGCILLEMYTGKLVRNYRDMKELRKQFFEGLVIFPTVMSKEAEGFIKGCLSTKELYRFSAELLLCHPFLEGVDDTIPQLETNAVDSKLGSSESISDSESSDHSSGLSELSHESETSFSSGDYSSRLSELSDVSGTSLSSGDYSSGYSESSDVSETSLSSGHYSPRFSELSHVLETFVSSCDYSSSYSGRSQVSETSFSSGDYSSGSSGLTLVSETSFSSGSDNEEDVSSNVSNKATLGFLEKYSRVCPLCDRVHTEF